jgi:predicted esterase
VHRDLKPANIMLTNAGVKLLDFGLARPRQTAPADERSARVTGDVSVTGEGMVVGTLPYMSPEQVKGQACDARTDLFALGAVLYEMISGVRAFAADSQAQLIADILDRDPAPLVTRQPRVPESLERLVATCLAKNVDDRWQRADDVARRLREIAAERTRSLATSSRRRAIARPMVAIPLAAVLLGAIVAAVVIGIKVSNQRWAKTVALPEIARLADRNDFVAAVDLAWQAHSFLGDDAELAALWPRITRMANIQSEPAGAQISYASYGADTAWRAVGATPLKKARLPMGLLRLKAEKPGFVTAEDVTYDGPGLDTPSFTLAASGAAPTGMVRASAVRGDLAIFVFGGLAKRASFDGFWIDRHEVTNRQYKAFLDAGGYKRREFWRHPFVQDGKTISFDEALGMFRDATGRPGPATWTLGSYPPGEDGLPVSGVSWYEASAYAAFAGRSLPTVYHWFWVASPRLTEFVAPSGNYSSPGPVAVDRPSALHRFGAYGLAGNVKEWCLNDAPHNRRYILGGGWDEPPYSFGIPDARSPFDRQRNFGFRTVKYDDGDRSIQTVSGILVFPSRSYTSDTRVGDDEFRAYQRMYSYDQTDLVAKVESVERANADWRVEKVSFQAAYGRERVITYLLLPTQGQPPYQTVVYMPGGDAWDRRTSPSLADPPFAFLLKSGRAVAFPIYKGSYERAQDDFLGSGLQKSSSRWRDHMIMWSKDVRRTVDYLATRSDIDSNKIAYLGISRGAALAPVMLAPEPRIKVAALWVPGFYAEAIAPEVDPNNFAPRVTIPVLQLNGRYDYVFPDDTSSLPFFQAFGTPPDRKRRKVYDTGHNMPENETIRETLDWFDRYLGPPR